ncbi:MAG: hypothetical protein ABI419_09440 [Ginsengibacter sp.]
MKTAEEIKRELHEYIDSITDEETLMQVHEEVASYLKKDFEEKIEEDELSVEQISEIQKGLKQIEIGETVDWTTYLNATTRWHTK